MWAFMRLCYTANVGLLSECSILTVMGPHSLLLLSGNFFIVIHDRIFRE